MSYMKYTFCTSMSVKRGTYLEITYYIKKLLLWTVNELNVIIIKRSNYIKLQLNVITKPKKMGLQIAILITGKSCRRYLWQGSQRGSRQVESAAIPLTHRSSQIRSAKLQGDKVVRWADKPQSQIFIFFQWGRNICGGKGAPHTQWDTSTRDARILSWSTKRRGICGVASPSWYIHIFRKRNFLKKTQRWGHQEEVNSKYNCVPEPPLSAVFFQIDARW